ncbi:MAG: hypothetical protein JWQ97_494, partial [Phenylobacterium sp.]|nr:hypothetical protein [Phenylobacterium sp.]
GLVVQVALHHQVREVLETSRVSALKLGAYAWDYAIRFAPPCTVMQLVVPPLFYEELKIPVLPWDGPHPGPDPGPEGRAISAWPIPPRQTAQAALGGALIAFAELDSLEAVGSERGSQLLRAGARAGLAALVREELGHAQAALKQLDAAAQRLLATPANQA